MLNSKDFKDLEDCINSIPNGESAIVQTACNMQGSAACGSYSYNEGHVHTFLDDYESNEVSEQDYMELLSAKFTSDILEDNHFNIFMQDETTASSGKRQSA